MRHHILIVFLLVLSSPASAVSINWTPVGNAGNACQWQQIDGQYGFESDPAIGVHYDPICLGGVSYDYQIGAAPVTYTQYAEFLNAKAASDQLELYAAAMADPVFGGITQSCSPSCTYSIIAGREDVPVGYVNFYDAARFANWMNNGQGAGDTETGSYTLTADGIATNTVTRNAGVSILLASEDEWYKAVYLDALTLAWNEMPGGGAVTDIRGSDWTEGLLILEGLEAETGLRRVVRGSVPGFPEYKFAAWYRAAIHAGWEEWPYGFRLVHTPDVGTGVMMALGLVAMALTRCNKRPARHEAGGA
jgi:hypothetical protein